MVLKGKLQNLRIEGTGGVVLKPENKLGSVVQNHRFNLDTNYEQNIYIFSCLRRGGLLRTLLCIYGLFTIKNFFRLNVQIHKNTRGFF